jgi:predicted nucleotidyltransferase
MQNTKIESPDEAKAVLLTKFKLGKQYRLGARYGDVYDLAEELGLKLNNELSGYYHCPNPFSWTIFEGTDFAIMKYEQRYYEGFNTYTIFGKDRKAVMALIERMADEEIIKRVKR